MVLNCCMPSWTALWPGPIVSGCVSGLSHDWWLLDRLERNAQENDSGQKSLSIAWIPVEDTDSQAQRDAEKRGDCTLRVTAPNWLSNWRSMHAADADATARICIAWVERRRTAAVS